MSEKKPDCFGDMDTVFPVSEDGLRESPEHCKTECKFNRECLKKALDSTKGKEVEEEKIDAMYESGNMNFFTRWAKKKALHKKDKKRS